MFRNNNLTSEISSKNEIKDQNFEENQMIFEWSKNVTRFFFFLNK
jgi:hypothetical protein